MDWDACYRQRETPWDKAAPAPELPHSLAEGHLSGRVLVPGCGRGHDVRAIAGAGGREVVGLDLSPTAVREAEEMGVPASVQFVEGDLFSLPPSMQGAFDWVWEHTCFCAIKPELRPKYVNAMHSVLRPDGYLLALFFLDPGTGGADDGPPFGVSRLELNALFDHAFVLESEWNPRAAYSGREGREWVRLLRRR
jgi:SAM-dependent methyltransferase